MPEGAALLSEVARAYEYMQSWMPTRLHSHEYRDTTSTM